MSSELAKQSEGGIFPLVHNAKAVLEMHKQIEDFCRDALEEGVDVGNAPGAKPDKTTGKISRMLFRPGMEKLAMAFGFTPFFIVQEKDIDYNAEVVYDGSNEIGEPTTYVRRGLIRMIVECKLASKRSGEIVGSGVGAASTLEKRYENRPRDLENTVLKQAQTRAFRAAIMTTLAMSGRFELDEPSEEGAARKSATRKAEPAAPAPEKNSAVELATWAKGTLGWPADSFEEFKRACAEKKKSWTKILVSLRESQGDAVGLADAMTMIEEGEASPESQAQPITGETISEPVSKRAALEALFNELEWTVETPEKFKLALESLSGKSLELMPEDANAPAYADALEALLAIAREEKEAPALAGITPYDPFKDE